MKRIEVPKEEYELMDETLEKIVEYVKDMGIGTDKDNLSVILATASMYRTSIMLDDIEDTLKAPKVGDWY